MFWPLTVACFLCYIVTFVLEHEDYMLLEVYLSVIFFGFSDIFLVAVYFTSSFKAYAVASFKAIFCCCYCSLIACYVSLIKERNGLCRNGKDLVQLVASMSVKFLVR